MTDAVTNPGGAHAAHRYHRQTLLAGIGEAGQARLGAGHALIVGCGALGTVSADLLVRAGVGTVTIVDRDIVEWTNLQRQTLFTETDVREGLPKAEAARRRLEQVNADVRIRAIVADFNPQNASGLMAGKCDPPGVIVDGTDNFETRYLLNDLAVSNGVPYAYGGAVGTRGMSMTIVPGRTSCLRCIFDEPPPPGAGETCDTVGVLAPVAAIVASCQAADAIKVLVGREDLLSGTLLEFDLWHNQRRRIDVSAPAAGCPCCGAERFEFLDGQRGSGAVSLCGRDAVQVRPGSSRDGVGMDLARLHERLSPHGRFEVTPHLIRGTLKHEQPTGGDGQSGSEGGGVQITVFADGRALFHGIREEDHARALYARYIGA